MRAILSAFDIRKLKSKCNFPGCESKPVLEVSIFQKSHRRGGRSLASIYVCKSHITNAERLVFELREATPGMMTEYITTEISKGR